jgi:glycosyltransferase involved in cell wall biosynthesis
MQPGIDIILSTYNGGKFLREQLDSILAQTFTDWRLLIRDDGSLDDTEEIVRDYARRHPLRILHVESAGENLGACQSFGRLLHCTDAAYVMLCDQDDIWFPDKIERTLEKMRRMEEENGPGSPCLVFSDVTVVDETLRVISPSGWRCQKSDPVTGTRLGRLVLMNPGNGCTMMINRELLKVAAPIPREALMHDYWLALAAVAFGRTGFLREPTLYYRQHGGNELGSKRWGSAYVLGLLRNLSAARGSMERHRQQALAFYERDHDNLKAGDREVLSAYVQLPQRAFWRKRFDLIKYGFFYVGALRNIGWFILV